MNAEELKKAIEQEQQNREALRTRIDSLSSGVKTLIRWRKEEQEEIKTNQDVIAMLHDMGEQHKADTLRAETALLERTVQRRYEEIKTKEDMIAMLIAVDIKKVGMLNEYDKELRDRPLEEGALVKPE